MGVCDAICTVPRAPGCGPSMLLRLRRVTLRQLILLFLSAICFAAAFLSLPLPLPLGFVFFVIGLSLLLIASDTARRWFEALRERFPLFDRRLRSVESYLPEFVRRALSATPPGQE